MVKRREGVEIRLGKEGKWDDNEEGRGWNKVGKGREMGW